MRSHVTMITVGLSQEAIQRTNLRQRAAVLEQLRENSDTVQFE